jgi:hypothetical protein
LERSAVFELFFISHHFESIPYAAFHNISWSSDAATLHTHSAYLTHSQFVDDLLPV